MNVKTFNRHVKSCVARTLYWARKCTLLANGDKFEMWKLMNDATARYPTHSQMISLCIGSFENMLVYVFVNFHF